ncbi:putative bifunctional diguanylate cyclase/phosphodiesterase [Propionivibrio sp.]|uniref:putative bifunctional diguanylate cyclase/phosphodiesterase n=1 Tax=Propionivibrio sp. TaxID=2212460 RepID=UPI0039E3AA7A
MQAFWRRSILVRAAMQVVGIGLVVGLGFVFLTAHLTERYHQQGVSQRIRELMTTVESTAQIACFTKDPALALEVVNGLARNSEVFGATIVGGSEILAERRKNGEGADRLRLATNGRISKAIASPFDAAQIVGELIIDPDPEIVSTRVKESGAFVALLLGLQLLVVVSAVAAAVLLWIVRPIKRMSDKLHVMDAHSIEQLAVPRGHENTEIGRLAADINQLGQRLVASLDEERHLHVQREIGERKYRAIFENADSGIFVVDRQLALESCNHAFYRQLGLPPGEKPDLPRLRWRDPEALPRLVEQCAVLNRSVSDDCEYAVGDGAVRWFSVTLTPIGDGLIQGQLTDISRHKQAELSAQQEAVTDALTGLLNRAGFLQKIDDEVAACADDENAGFALLIVDLDGFRRVNESLGLASGDRILSITAHRLRACVKSSDHVSRLGNDSFGIVLRATADEKAAAGVAMRISVSLKGFFEVGSAPLQLGASIGIALFPHDGGDRELLLRNAEMALEHARLGGSRYCFFDFTMARNAEYRRHLENDLRFAVRRNELIIHFQPIIDLSVRRMAGAEALIRWAHPQRGMIPPDVFVPLAEETGAIINIGLWMVEAVCQQLANWKRQGRADRYISINVSARQIPDGLPPITLIETANRYGVDPGNLAIEITESVFMGDSEAAKTWLDAVHELGFRIYLDDFGTGYSSLSYIKRFPVDVLKVDKSFVRDMSEDNSDRALVGAIINMARSLELTVVAEGVESQRQLDLLEAAGCRCVQGYYFSRPVPADAIEDASRRIEQLL